jgi:acyl carrier protein
MELDEVLKQVNQIFVKVLDNPAIVLKSETSAKDIEEWDSLTHIQLIVAIEKHFKIKFTSSEIQKWKNVGEILASVKNRLG